MGFNSGFKGLEVLQLTSKSVTTCIFFPRYANTVRLDANVTNIGNMQGL